MTHASARTAHCKLFCVDPARVPEIWPQVEPMIRSAVERSVSTDILTVIGKMMRMAALLWVVWDGIRFRAAIVTSISAVNGRKQCVIVACGGDGLTAGCR